MERGVPSMHLRLLRHKAPQHEVEDGHQPNRKRLESGTSEHQRRVVAPMAAATARSREAEAGSEWPWWLSLPATGAGATGRGSDDDADLGRRWSLQQDESDDPTSLPAA